MKKTFLSLAVLMAFAAVAVGSYLWGAHVQQHATSAVATVAPRKVLYWYDPMLPDKHFNHPGKSPFMPSMDMVPKYVDQGSATDAPAVVHIDPRIEQNIGLRSAVVRVAVLVPELRVTGVLDWDRRRSLVVSARADGVLTRLFVRAPFDRVRAGQPLGVLLAPAWSAAVAELHALSGTQSSSAQGLRSAALERLHVLGMSPAEIHQLSANPAAGIVLRAPGNGVISTLDVRPGQSVNAGTTLMRIDDPARLWLNAEIPQAEVAGIHAGSLAQIEIDAIPGRIFKGTVEALLPEVDPRTRTETARITLENPHGILAPGMYAMIRLSPASGKSYPLVPDEALISTGLQNRVILDLGAGRLEPRVVRTGRSANGYTEVLAGLRGGERVVTSGQFLIDSEADLDGTLQRLTVPAAPASPAPASTVHAVKRKVLYWYDPMAPAKHFSHGGPSPLMPSMDLLPQYAGKPASGAALGARS